MFIRHLIHVIHGDIKEVLINIYIEGQKYYKNIIKSNDSLFDDFRNGLRRPNLRDFHHLIHAMSYDSNIRHRQYLT